MLLWPLVQAETKLSQFPIEFENFNDIPSDVKNGLKKSPFESGIRNKPTEALVNVTLTSFIFHEHYQKVQATFDISVGWKDERLKLKLPWNQGSRRKMGPQNSLWYPNITHANTGNALEIDAWISFLYVENQLNITHQGIKLEFDCLMEYRWFPFDSHVCQFGLKLSEEKKHIQFQEVPISDLSIKARPGILVVPQWSISPELEIATFKAEADNDADEELEFSGLQFEFHFNRILLLYFWQIYIPSILLCVAANGALFIPSDLIPGRMTLSVTSFLSLVALFNGARSGQNHWPQASYVNAMDVWQMLCYLIVFFILVEYCFVLYLTKIPDWKNKIEPKINRNLESVSKHFFHLFKIKFSNA